jgi:hypothetical protein
MSQIFISYSRRDVEIVDRIVGSLNEAALKVWIDREDIASGNSWRVQIVEAIDTCGAFVLMLSGNSAISTNVQKEVILAQDSGRRIFVVMLDPVKPPAELRYQLAGLQFIDLQMLGLDKSIAQLINALKEHIRKIKPAVEQTQHQTELVIQGIDISAFTAEKQQQLLEFISNLASTDQSQLKIANMTAGSVHVFMDMPAGSAYELKTLALNRDKRFKKLGITSLRLAGDSKFINISLGILTAAATIGFLQSLWLSVPSMLVPVLGVTIGKVLTISLAVVVVAGLALSAPNVIAPLLSPPSTPISTLISTSTPAPTATQVSVLTSTPTEIFTLTVTPLPVATPQNPLVLSDIVCWVGPGPNYEVAGALKKGTRVELTGRAKGWWIVDHPRFHTDCWVMEQDLQIEPDIDTSSLPIISPPVFPTRTPRPEPVRPTPTCDVEDPACYTPFPSTY